MKFSLVYITAKNKDEAKRIGEALVAERLAACVNIIEGMNSMYWWDGKIEYDSEAVLIAKTRASLVKALIAKVKSAHSYSCPCIVALPILDGNKDYLLWIEKETRQ
ncbi:MAG: divalent-cation tolerance protein CutA [Candidatus Omnitrophica bacterium]|nr:divalent-cation tolerance protein CutA [Candidatus Omnitrophota bacterium]